MKTFRPAGTHSPSRWPLVQTRGGALRSLMLTAVLGVFASGLRVHAQDGATSAAAKTKADATSAASAAPAEAAAERPVPSKATPPAAPPRAQATGSPTPDATALSAPQPKRAVDAEAPGQTPSEAGVAATSAPASASEDPSAGGEAPYGLDESMGVTMFKTFIALGLVILITYFSLNVVLRKMMGVRPGRFGKHGLLEVVERAPLEPKKSLYVVKAGGKYLLVGTAEHGVHTLGELDSDAVEKSLAEAKASASAPSPAQQWLTQILSGRKRPS